MSDLTVMEAMVARELWNTADDYGNPEDYVEQARALIHSLRPIIEAEVRERIAAEIEAERDRVWIEPNLVLVNGAQVLDRHVYAAQWTEAARIARGQS